MLLHIPQYYYTCVTAVGGAATCLGCQGAIFCLTKKIQVYHQKKKFKGRGCTVRERERFFFGQSGALLRVLVGKARDRAARMYNKVEVKGGLITKVLLTYFYYY